MLITRLAPTVDAGRFPAKRCLGDEVEVRVEAITDGHDLVCGQLRWRHESDDSWRQTLLSPVSGDVFRASFLAERLGRYRFTVSAWVDRFGSWARDLAKRAAAGQELSTELLDGAGMIEAASAAAAAGSRSEPGASAWLRASAELLRSGAENEMARDSAVAAATSAALLAEMRRVGPRGGVTDAGGEFEVVIEPVLARFSAWYELFPRSASPEPGRHGTLRDVADHLDDIAEMGFDVLYLPPIHPIGRVARKGRNNAERAQEGDVGSPWAIGAQEGGHTAVHPDLGDVRDVELLASAARERGIELALDIAFQCAPDHPWVSEHPEWFRHRADGSIRYAENPPKKYQDIYPLDFESERWQELWDALLGVVRFWIDRGVRVFRVDNPHTKPVPFWEWLIRETKRDNPETIFLSEAFTRPAMMMSLAKAGFSQSYTYFAWRNTKAELTEYFEELARGETREFFRPNLWPNTPDILPEYLQTGGREAFQVRLILAATLGASYGVYGPAFDWCEGRAVRHGSEEYLDSEKYQLRAWPPAPRGAWDASLRPLMRVLNAARRRHAALSHDSTLRFHRASHPAVLCYSKVPPGGVNGEGHEPVVCAVNLEPASTAWAELDLPLESLGIDPKAPYQVHDLLTGARYSWVGWKNVVGLGPGTGGGVAHVFVLRQRARREHDFEYFG